MNDEKTTIRTYVVFTVTGAAHTVEVVEGNVLDLIRKIRYGQEWLKTTAGVYLNPKQIVAVRPER